MESRIQLPELAPKLRPFLGEATPSYQRLYQMGVSGVLPLQKHASSGRYFIMEADLPAVVSAIQKATAPRHRRAA